MNNRSVDLLHSEVASRLTEISGKLVLGRVVVIPADYDPAEIQGRPEKWVKAFTECASDQRAWLNAIVDASESMYMAFIEGKSPSEISKIVLDETENVRGFGVQFSDSLRFHEHTLLTGGRDG